MKCQVFDSYGYFLRRLTIGKLTPDAGWILHLGFEFPENGSIRQNFSSEYVGGVWNFGGMRDFEILVTE